MFALDYGGNALGAFALAAWERVRRFGYGARAAEKINRYLQELEAVAADVAAGAA